MRNLRLTRLRLLILLASLAFIPASLMGQNFVYVNNNIPSANTVSGFSVSTSGALTPLTGSAFPTGGSGGGIYTFAAVNELALSPDGAFLFAANAGSKNVSVFSINKATGALTLVGSPVPTGGNDCDGISLAEAVTTSGQFLYAANTCSSNITVFSVASDGTLTAVGSPVSLPSNPDGINVRPDGQFLAVALPFFPNKVAVFNIGPGGVLTAVPGSPFAAGGSGLETGVDYKCGSKILFGGEDNSSGTIVDVFDVASNGALGAIPGSPFTFGSGTALNSNVVLFSPFSQLLFVSNQFSGTVSDFTVAHDGSLPVNLGARFSDGTSFPAGMAVGSVVTNPITGASTTFLYVVNAFSNNVAVFSVADGGDLTLVTASPFSTGQGGVPVSVVAYPPLGCRVK